MNPLEKQGQEDEPAQPDSYEPPCIESVLTAEELEREVLYAGRPISIIPGGSLLP